MITTTINLKFRPSRYLITLLLLIYSGPLIFIGFLPLKVWVIGTLESLCIIHLYRNIQHYALLSSPQSVIALHYTKDQGFRLTCRNNETISVNLLKSSYASPYLLVLNFKCQGSRFKKYSVVILPDMISAQDFRQLRVKLKYFHS